MALTKDELSDLKSYIDRLIQAELKAQLAQFTVQESKNALERYCFQLTQDKPAKAA